MRSLPIMSTGTGSCRRRALCRCWTTCGARAWPPPNPRGGARRVTSSLVSIGTGWLVGERSRLTRSAATRGWHTGSSWGEPRPRMSSGVERLTGADVTGFLLRESTRVRPGSVCCHANQLRQLLRYLSMRGFVDPGLAGAVPSVARWREAGVPQFPERPAIERMLESCDLSRRVGVRDFAILMLLRSE